MQVMTIREAVERAVADGIPLSTYALRRFVKTGEIPCRKVGTKVLIYYPHIVQYFTQASESTFAIQRAVSGNEKK